MNILQSIGVLSSINVIFASTIGAASKPYLYDLPLTSSLFSGRNISLSLRHHSLNVQYTYRLHQYMNLIMRQCVSA